MSVYLSLVTVAQGEVVKKLAGWAALLAAPTLPETVFVRGSILLTDSSRLLATQTAPWP